MFDDTSEAFNNSTTFNSGDQTRDKGKSRVQTLLPVCIRQILDCSGDDFMLFGTKGNILTVVAILKNMNITSTKATYEIEDHTGKIEAILWLESQFESDTNLPDVKEGCYVRVMGSYRLNQDIKSLLVLKITSVEDPNEVTTHLLECMHVRYALEKGTDSERGSKKGIEETVVADSGFTALQEKILKVLRADDSLSGVHINAIISGIPGGNAAQIKKAINDLQAEGNVFSTIDTEHFKTTT